MKLPRPALLVLEDGSLFEGISFGHLSHSAVHAVGEVVFNTAMTGYQEVLSDPSYAGQLVTLTYPHIGNVGVNLDDQESNLIYANGLIIRQLPYQVSNWRHQMGLEQFLAQQRVVGIAEIDTRRLTRLLREKGALKGCIYSAPSITEQGINEALARVREFPGLIGADLAKEVSTPSSYLWQEGGLWPHKKRGTGENWQVVAYDFGIKKTILRSLYALGCTLTVVPAKTTAAEVLALQPDGVFLSNGPGDPEACQYAISAIQQLLSHNLPIFGICLGHQLLALALEGKTMKMKCGHHGSNHPVRDLRNNKVLITSQNHGFTVDETSLPSCLAITHRSLFDNTIQGIRHRHKPVFGFQGHPEAGPGPNEARTLFEEFIQDMRDFRFNRQAASTALLATNE